MRIPTERLEVRQRPIYYFFRALHGAEVRYPPIELLAMAVVVASRRLLPYIQPHSIVIPTSYPLFQFLHKSDISKLSQFDIHFIPTKAMKGQDFMVELTPKSLSPREGTWIVYQMDLPAGQDVEKVWSSRSRNAKGQSMQSILHSKPRTIQRNTKLSTFGCIPIRNSWFDKSRENSRTKMILCSSTVRPP